MRGHFFRAALALLGGALAGAVLVAIFSSAATAQQKPPRPIRVYTSASQNLTFGSFFQGGTGGTVTVDASGARTTAGSLVGASFGAPPSAALFEIDAEPGTVITLLTGPDVVLTGSTGGTVDLTIGSPSLLSPFVTTAVPPARTQLTVGGTLMVGDPITSPAGSYSGTFHLIFFQQ